MNIIRIFIITSFLMLGSLSAHVRVVPTRADTHAVMAQFMGIVASGLAFVASSSDKEAQLHALSNIAQGVAHIIELARDSDDVAAGCIKELNDYNSYLSVACVRRGTLK